MEEKITLDLNSFKALASETRVHILKKLGGRRATASELASSLEISVQAASEHLEKMRAAGLVARVSREEEPPRKWVYYELTDKGRALLQPESTKKIWVLLSASILAIAAGFSRILLDVFSPRVTLTPSGSNGFSDYGVNKLAVNSVEGIQKIVEATARAVEAAGGQAAASVTPVLKTFAASPTPRFMGVESGISGVANVTANASNASVNVVASAVASVQPSTQFIQAGAQATQGIQIAQGAQAVQAAQAAQAVHAAGGIALNSFELLLIVFGALALGASVMLLARARQRKAL